MIAQLRTYTINKGMMDDWLKAAVPSAKRNGPNRVATHHAYSGRVNDAKEAQG